MSPMSWLTHSQPSTSPDSAQNSNMSVRNTRFRWRLRLGAPLACAGLLFFAGQPLAMAQEPTERVEAHLQNGEFAPALNVARQAAPAQKDRLLQRIAAVQAQTGNLRGAVDSMADVSSDTARAAGLSGISGRPVGNFGNPGGMGEPDFDALIELIETTVSPESWDAQGGPGAIAEFEGGVRVDASGLVHSLLQGDSLDQLRALRGQARSSVAANADVRRDSGLRKVSLTRLEKLVQLKQAAGEPLTDDIRYLAGLHKISYVLLYPETGEIVLAGPAGDWQSDREGRVLNARTSRPVLHLDDLVVVLRHMTARPNEPFGCSIVPIKENLAKTKAFLEESSQRALKPGERDRWLANLRDQMGQQTVEYYGIDPQSHVARVLFEADYRMKLVGIGLEPGSVNVPSYLSSVKVAPGEAAPPMGVLRWWFTLNYDSILASPEHDAFELRGQGVKVLSENEMITAQGDRVHTGQSDPLTAGFAQNFTEHFGELAAKYPVYAELQNIFDLALASALIQAQRLPEQAGWNMTCFGEGGSYQPSFSYAPQKVETVMNHRVVNRVQILAAASGGVRVDPASLVKAEALQTDSRGVLGSRREQAAAQDLPRLNWWWD